MPLPADARECEEQNARQIGVTPDSPFPALSRYESERTLPAVRDTATEQAMNDSEFGTPGDRNNASRTIRRSTKPAATLRADRARHGARDAKPREQVAAPCVLTAHDAVLPDESWREPHNTENDMRPNNNALTATPTNTTLDILGELYTMEVTLNGDTRTVTFWRHNTATTVQLHAVHHDDTAIAIAKHGGKVWPAQLMAWQNADGTFRIATNYHRLNRGGYDIRGWFNTIAPNAEAAFVSKHVSA